MMTKVGTATLVLVVVAAAAAFGAEALRLKKLQAVRVEAPEPARFVQDLTRTDYCRNRKPSQCCRDVRDDDCSVPIRDSLCYCDEFCLKKTEGKANGPNKNKKEEHDDCCPDFREVCLGKTEQLDLLKKTADVCYHNGKSMTEGSYTINCNKCKCTDGKVHCEKDWCLVDEGVIQYVNKYPSDKGWTATNYSMFWGRKARDGIAQKTGTNYPDSEQRMLPIHLSPKKELIDGEFDAREKWSGLISGVKDQKWCAASWIFSTLGVAQDRTMILSTRQSGLSLAPQEVLSCSARSPKNNCYNGGSVEIAWGYLKKYGVVEERCYPYSSGGSRKVNSCRKDSSCQNYRMEPAYRISSKVEDIQWEIMNNGPVQALMTVHRELFMYKSGVYQCPITDVSDQHIGMHSVRIVGWGVDTTFKSSPTEYWLVANSWGTKWGERGYFRIRRGVNECNIESFVLAVRPVWKRQGPQDYKYWFKQDQGY